MSTTINPACAYVGIATAIVTGLSHLEGQEVSILANGEVLTNATVSGGEVSLGNSYSVAHVGLPYYADLETLDIEVPMYEGTVMSRKIKVGNTMFRLEKSRGGYIGPDENNIWEAFTADAFRLSSGQQYLGNESLFTGDIRQSLGAGYSQGGNIFYRQKDPLPVTIGAITPEVSVGGATR